MENWVLVGTHHNALMSIWIYLVTGMKFIKHGRISSGDVFSCQLYTSVWTADHHDVSDDFTSEVNTNDVRPL